MATESQPEPREFRGQPSMFETFISFLKGKLGF